MYWQEMISIRNETERAEKDRARVSVAFDSRKMAADRVAAA